MKYVKNRYGYQKKRKQKKTGRIIVSWRNDKCNGKKKKKKFVPSNGISRRLITNFKERDIDRDRTRGIE